jgi:hypothetical protein
MRFNARHMSHHGPPHPFRYAGVVADSCDVEVPICSQQDLQERGIVTVTTGRNPEDSNGGNAVGPPPPIHWL